jgi:uncharacterized protein (DUF362 family)
MGNSNILSIRKIAEDDVYTAVVKVLKDLQASQLMKENMKILVKPNLLGPHHPDRAVTTHPKVIRAIIKWLKQYKPEKIYVGDSSGGKSSKKTLQAFEKSGILQVCEEEEAVAIPLEKTERRIYKISNPLVLDQIVSTHLIADVDLIINVPKIKTHELTALTCAIKNMFGTVLLVNKAKIHAKFTTMDTFNAALVDVYSVSKPQLTIVDGYLCQEGKGPAAGDVVKLDLIVGGYDGVAVDTLVSRIIDLNPKKVLYLHKAENQGLGSMNLANFTLKGNPVHEVKRSFKVKKHFWVDIPLPEKWAKYIANILFHSRIKIDPKKCKLCGNCWQNCPVNALTPPEIKKIGEYAPKWDKNQCITCFCCTELCPYEAISFKVNYIRNFIISPLGALCGVSLISIILIILIVI